MTAIEDQMVLPSGNFEENLQVSFIVAPLEQMLPCA